MVEMVSRKRISAKEIKENLLHVFASAREGIVITDENGMLFYYNQACADILGYKYDELERKNWKELVHPKGITVWNELLRASLEKCSYEGLNREFECFKKDGTLIIVEGRATARFDGCGNHVGFICFLSDITEKKRTEYQLSTLKNAIETSREVVFMTDEKGIFSYVNPEFIRVYGYNSEEVLGKLTPLVLKSEISTLEEVESVLLKLKNHEMYRGNWATVTNEGLLIYMSFSASPYMNEHGDFAGYIVMGRDVTEKIIARDALKASERLLAGIINSLPEPTFVINKDHKVIIWNKAVETFTGIKTEDVLLKDNYAHSKAIFGQNSPMAADLLIQPDPFYENQYLSFQRFENTVVSEISALVPMKTEEAYIWSIASKLYDSEGNVTGAIQTFRDISELKKFEQELRLTKDKAEEHNRLKSYFIANMSHELRTPLVGILGFSELLLSEIEQEDIREKIGIIFHSGKRLMETLNGILDFSKLESNRFEVHTAEVNISDLMRGIIKIYEPSAQEKDLSLVLDIREKEIFARLDESILIQAMKNILSNAVKYTIKGGVNVSVFKELMEDSKFWVSISVTDTGIGISIENQKLIFEPFRQVSEGFNRKYEGIGLGLSLTKKFVELMHGKITLKSKEGKGTKVKISLPLSEESPPLKYEIPAHKDEIRQGEKKSLPTILYVEDDAVSQTVMKLFLKGLAEVDIAPDAENALRMIVKKEYCAFLMDMNLGGGLNGLETAAAIREMAQYKETPFIAVTAYATAGEKERILSQGCDYYLAKPFTRLDITGLVKQVLEI